MDPALHDHLRASIQRTYDYEDPSPPQTPIYSSRHGYLLPFYPLEITYQGTSVTSIRPTIPDTTSTPPTRTVVQTRITSSSSSLNHQISRSTESQFAVPAHIFAESCPMCDEMALETTEGRVPLRYPQGWKLIYVGGAAEVRARSANRHAHRNLDKPEEEQKATERKKIATPIPETKTPSSNPSSKEPKKKKKKRKRTLPNLHRSNTNPPPPRLHPHLLSSLPNTLATNLHRCHSRNLAPQHTNPTSTLPSPESRVTVKVYLSNV
ncbi:unnamed protein product [Aureobasidium uvarum]|uniref:Uncharacterized protein n=1 Tax=Aureobasidium uvarum TaxID=2773716 RepID=A0A9N8KNQ6_9PEZI|nr:unnamed protein product [Aureobasidium uvarum]